MKNLFLGMLVLLAATGCDSDLLVSPGDEALTLRGEKKMVPFYGEALQWFDLEAGFSDCGVPGVQIPNRWEFEGDLSHMGHSTGWGEGYACTISPAFIFHGDYTGVIIAANGDEVWFEGWIEFDLVNNLFVASESEFTGGTGRWVNATGYFVSTGEPTETPGLTFYTHVGEISAPGKK